VPAVPRPLPAMLVMSAMPSPFGMNAMKCYDGTLPLLSKHRNALMKHCSMLSVHKRAVTEHCSMLSMHKCAVAVCCGELSKHRST